MTKMYVAISHGEGEYHREYETVLGIYSTEEEAVQAVMPYFETLEQYKEELRIKEIPVGTTSLIGMFNYRTLTKEDYKKYIGE